MAFGRPRRTIETRISAKAVAAGSMACNGLDLEGLVFSGMHQNF
jgi:hypothetical protein